MGASHSIVLKEVEGFVEAIVLYFLLLIIF